MPHARGTASGFDEHLTSLRKERGIIQAQLADALGATQRAISYYENKCDCPPGPVLIEIARVLRVGTDELLGVTTMRGSKVANKANLETRRLWKKIQQIMAPPAKDRRAVIRPVNSLIQARS